MTYLLISSHQMDRVEGLCEQVIMLNNGNTVAQGKIEELKKKHGNSRITIPYSDEAYQVLQKYKPVKREHAIVVDLIDENTTCGEVMNDLIQNNVLMNYLKYDQISMNDLFIRLLGE